MLGNLLPLWSVVPFACMLLCIAILPLLAPHFWESNWRKLLVALLFGLPTALFIGCYEWMPVLHELQEYCSFIILLAALFIISGGIVLRGDIEATPLVNASFLGVGAVLANIIGTTGASMVLIRPLLRTNSERRRTKHIPVFFIFVVSNIGGLLTPLGDPPLFLGFLRGVPFFWTLRLWPIWLVAVGAVIAVFYIWDHRAYRQEAPSSVLRDKTQIKPLRLVGLRNLPLLALIMVAAFLPTPWRELLMIAAAAASLYLTPTAYRRENGFSLGPIYEVAALFLGIFLSMIPALQILQARGAELGISQPWQYFWATGSLSSFLDNAPTYLAFASLAQGQYFASQIIGVPEKILAAISAGAVFMGANSYIGNGPNFMVKAIAEEAGHPMPHFFGYMVYSFALLLPVFLLVTIIFFR